MTTNQRNIVYRTVVVILLATALLLPINHIVNGNGSDKIVDPFNAQLMANATEVCNDR